MQETQSNVAHKRACAVRWLLGAVAASAIPFALTSAPVWAQDDGGHVDGGGEDGGGEVGGGGKGQGHGGGRHGKPKPGTPLPITPDTGARATATDRAAAAASRGTYMRFEIGAAQPGAGNANWLPPGYPDDPQVFFDIDLDPAVTGAVAVGRSYGNGWRLEAALNVFGSADFSGPWSYTVPADPGPHANVEGSVRSMALFANGYYDFAAIGGATPFVTAGLGVAHNSMADWTRINPDSDRATRSFAGGSDTGLALSVGAGVALDVGRVLGSAPAKLELTWRYYDLGSVSGTTTPLPGSGAGGTPVEALNFDVTDQVISVGLRIPF